MFGTVPNTYAVYPGTHVNSSDQMVMSYMKSGTDSLTDDLSMWVTGRVPSDAAGTMQTPVIVPAGWARVTAIAGQCAGIPVGRDDVDSEAGFTASLSGLQWLRIGVLLDLVSAGTCMPWDHAFQRDKLLL